MRDKNYESNPLNHPLMDEIEPNHPKKPKYPPLMPCPIRALSTTNSLDTLPNLSTATN